MDFSGKLSKIVKQPVVDQMIAKMPYLKTNRRGVLFQRVKHNTHMSEINCSDLRLLENNPDVLMECDFVNQVFDLYQKVDFKNDALVLSEGQGVLK